MKIVIDIPDEVYKNKDFVNYYGAWSGRHQKAISEGQPLSEIFDKIKIDISNNAELNEHEESVVLEDSIYKILEKYKAVSE